MTENDTLTPQEASAIATNSYFTLKDWAKVDTRDSKLKPQAAVEDTAVVRHMVLGEGKMHRGTQTSLGQTALKGASLEGVFAGNTGFATTSGFGYLLNLKANNRKHAILAMRGTRPELAGVLPDILTDLRGSLEVFGDLGLVHKGFKRTFDSVMRSLTPQDGKVMEAEVVHCVGHSLGGGVATLMAAHYRSRGKNVKLYTFGSPRVGALGTHMALQRSIGQNNIFRVAHDLDPITMVGPFPYIHVNAVPNHPQFMTIPSWVPDRITLDNHDMANYIASIGPSASWSNLHGRSKQLDHEDAFLARKLMSSGSDANWVHRASDRVLALLLKLIGYFLRGASTTAILSVTALDLLAEMVVTGMARAKALGDEIVQLLRHAATWAGITLKAGVDIGVTVIAAILKKMLTRVQQIAIQALGTVARNLQPLPWLLTGAVLLTSAVAL